MTELFRNWGFSVALILALVITIPALAALLGYFWYRVRRAELTASLVHDMLERGLSADQIRSVLEVGQRDKTDDLLEAVTSPRPAPPPPPAPEKRPVAEDPDGCGSGWRLRCLKCNKTRWLGPLAMRIGCPATRLVWCSRCQRPRWAALEQSKESCAS